MRQVTPAAEAQVKEIERVMAKYGFANIIELTEVMTQEEQEMAILEELLKEGYAPEDAEREAREKLALFNSVFGT